MTLARFQSTAVDTSGNVIAGASVTVRSQSTGNVVSIFSDRAGTVSLANPFTTDANGFFAFHVAGGTYRITISDGSTNSEITFVGVGRVQENEVIQVSSAGNVGIGTSSPNAKLVVQPTAMSGGGFQVSDYDSGSGAENRAVTATTVAYNNDTYADGFSSYYARGTAGSPLAIQSGDVTGYFYGVGYDGTDFRTFSWIEFPVDGAVSTGVMPLAIKFVTGSSAELERMRIDSAGRVGIGTSAPTNTMLHVYAGNGNGLKVENASTAQFTGATVMMKGPAGTIRGTGLAHGNENTGGTQTYFNIFCIDDTENFVKNIALYDYTGDFWQFFTNNTEKMRITSGGRVGIGTSSPDASALLDVTSTVGGVLFPRMTSTQRDAIGSPANGLVLYNTTTDKLQVRAGGSWVDLH